LDGNIMESAVLTTEKGVRERLDALISWRKR
jgi:hypothetical protein